MLLSMSGPENYNILISYEPCNQLKNFIAKIIWLQRFMEESLSFSILFKSAIIKTFPSSTCNISLSTEKSRIALFWELSGWWSWPTGTPQHAYTPRHQHKSTNWPLTRSPGALCSVVLLRGQKKLLFRVVILYGRIKGLKIFLKNSKVAA